MNFKKILFLFFCLIALVWCSCKDVWDEHTQLINTSNKLNLTEQISSEPTLSRFYELVQKAGVVQVLSSGNVYTVWAPDNQTLDSLIVLHPDYFANNDSLSSYVKYHITASVYPLSQRNDTLRLVTLNGKYRTVIGRDVEEEVITSPNIYTRNGVIHVVHHGSLVKHSIYDIIHQDLSSTLFVKEQIKINTVNPHWISVRDTIKKEDLQFTYFVLADQAYVDEYNKIRPFYVTASSKADSSTEYYTKLHLYQDVIVKGLYLQDNLPDVLTSIGGVKIHINKSEIVSSYRASNGIVYLVNKLPYQLQDRISGFKIQGESFYTRSSGTSTSQVLSYRTSRDTSGVLFTDFYSWSHRISNFFVQYTLPDIWKGTYKVYARSVSGLDLDPHNKTTIFIQRHWVSSLPDASTFTLQFQQNVDPSFNAADPNRQYREVYLGTYEKGQFGVLYWKLMGAAVGTDNEANMVNLDYIRFEPILP